MKHIQLPSGQTVLMDDADHELLCHYKWYAQKSGNTYYVKRNVIRAGRRTTSYLHREIMSGVGMIDHINRNGLDNRRENLRATNMSKNGANSRAKSRRSKHKGIALDTRDDKWYASIMCNGKRQYLGRYTSEGEAARAYNKAAIEAFGEHALPNEV